MAPLRQRQLKASRLATAVVIAATGLTAAMSATIPVTPAQASGLPRLTIAMNGRSITVGGALQSGAVNVVSTTTREAQGQPLLLRLNPDVTPAQAYAFASSSAARDLDNVSRVGSIPFDAQADNGTSHVQTSLQPGQYVAFDLAGPNPARAPHAAFAITQSAQPAALPSPQATIRAIDFAFRAPPTLHDSELVRFENDGAHVHMIVATQAPNAQAAKQIAAALRAGNDSKAKRLTVAGTTFADPLSPGASQQLTIDVTPGYWILASFVATKDGRKDTQLGMERIVHIIR
jgi:hypothetical protein